MTTAICTFCEGHYHYGLAALVNSLYNNGFKGNVYAGYRGQLPFWSVEKVESNLFGKGGFTLRVAEDLNLHFILVNTDFNLTNYKPFFMINVLENFELDIEAIAYIDPDIVVKCNWNFFETWMSHGVALVHEITANDMPASHPIRKEWEKVINKCNRQVVQSLTSYINAGFCGVSRLNFKFIYLWAEIINTAIREYSLKPTLFMPLDRTHVFYAGDQDALNIAAMCSENHISEIGPEGMDFIPGGWTMSHAVGSPKPWKNNFILSVLKGNPPSLADKAYWANVNGPLKAHKKYEINCLAIMCAAFVGRFYHRY